MQALFNKSTIEFQVEQELREESFGYRAKFIQRSAMEISEKGGLEWFQKVQDMAYKDAHAELVTLTGIGPKVYSSITIIKCVEKTYSHSSHVFRSLIAYA